MLAQIEDAIVNRLRTALGADAGGAYKVMTLEPYAGQIALGDGGKPIQAQTFALPAIFVTCAGLDRKEGLGSRTAGYKVEWIIYCVAYNPRNQAAAQRGDSKLAGTYQIAEDVAQILSAQTLGQQIRPIRVDAIKPMHHAARGDANAMSVMTVHISTEIVMQANLPDGDLLAEHLAQISTGFYVPEAPTPALEGVATL